MYDVNFTPREIEVHLELLKGLSRKDIAKKLMIKPSTVCTHVVSIFQKAAVNSQKELMAEEILHLQKECAKLKSNLNAA